MPAEGSATQVAPLSDPEFWIRSDREAAFAELRRDHPISWQPEPPTAWSSGGRGYWAVVNHAGVRTVSRQVQRFISGRGTELFELPVDVAQTYSGMLNMDAPRHTRLRSIVTAAFSPRYIARLESAIRERAERVIDAVSERGECDFATEVAEPFPIAVICDMMGVPESDRAEVARLSRTSVPLGDAEFGSFDDALQAALDLIEYAKVLGQERQRRPEGDLTTALITAEVDGERLSADEMGSFFELLITAGIETTAASIAHGLLVLCQNPDQRRLLYSDYARFAPGAIEEILRWSTPVIHFRRTATQDTDLDGARIAEGDKVVVFYSSANRDERVFADPYRFDIRRHPNPHVTFGGGGPHFCLGAHLARLEIGVMFEALHRRLGDIQLTGQPVLMHSMFFNGVKSLPCGFTPS